MLYYIFINFKPTSNLAMFTMLDDYNFVYIIHNQSIS